jgi:predicted dehydrogenase
MEEKGYPKIAIVGCGAISESYYLPALRRHSDVQLTLVDTDEQRLSTVGNAFCTKKGIKDYHEILGEVDGAIVATPHSSHHRIAMDFLREGSHVLCEKPLAAVAPDAREMIAQAEKSGVTLSVNNIRRLYPSFNEVKRIISKGTLGEVSSIVYLDGEVFSWPTVTGFFFDRQSSKGVLLDHGAHALDAICWWIGCKPDLISCQTDSFGGPEAAVAVKFRRGSITGEVRLSWLARLRNRYSIECENGRILGGTRDWGKLTVVLGSGKPRIMEVDPTTESWRVLRERMVDNFLSVVAGKADPLVPAREVVESLELIDESYAAAERFEMAWCDNVECI